MNSASGQWLKNTLFAVQMFSSNLQTYIYLLNIFVFLSVYSITEIGLLYLHCAFKCIQYYTVFVHM